MQTLPCTEKELKNYLIAVASGQERELPDWTELEPGSFLYVVKALWDQNRDQHKQNQKKWFLNDFQIAQFINDATGQKFTVTHYKLMFGSSDRRTKAGTNVPRLICKHFLLIAFHHWNSCDALSDCNHETGYNPILEPKAYNFDFLVEKLCDFIYQPEVNIRCIPSPGLGPIGLLKKCRRENRSIIVATDKIPVTFDNDGALLREMVEILSGLFADSQSEPNPFIHIWALREPFILNDPRSIAALQGIGALKTTFLTTKALCDCRQTEISWSDFAKRCVIVMLQNKENNVHSYPQPSIHCPNNPINGHCLFPCEVPVTWNTNEAKPMNINNLNFFTTIGHNNSSEHNVEYRVFTERKNYKTSPPVIQKPSPGKESDDSFINLYHACRTYLNQSSGMHNILNAAQEHGWAFFTPDEFLDLTIPHNPKTILLKSG